MRRYFSRFLSQFLEVILRKGDAWGASYGLLLFFEVTYEYFISLVCVS